MNLLRKKVQGFTLLEMMLVLLIMSAILVMFIGYTQQKGVEYRRDRTVLQMQQVLNAGLAYYINYSGWPDDLDALKNGSYLPKIDIINPWGETYTLSKNDTTGTFSVCTTVVGTGAAGGSIPTSGTASMGAQAIAGRLPMGYVADGAAATPCQDVPAPCTSDECTVVTTVNIPGQNINNARAVNFAGVYHNGGCVPVPKCPSLGPNAMKPSIIVAPTSVSGLNKGYDPALGGEVFPIESFTAYASEPAFGTPGPAKCTSIINPPLEQEPCRPGTDGNIEPDPQKYWRVCLAIETEEGQISFPKNPNWKPESGSIMAITRCAPEGEPIGSDFDVFDSF